MSHFGPHEAMGNAGRKRSTPIWLALLGAASLAAWVAAFVAPVSLLGVEPGTLPDLYKIHPPWSAPHWGMIAGFALLGGLYALGWRAARRARGGLAWAVVLGGSLLFGLALAWMFPHDAADLFDYLVHGRMTAVYGSNPYLQAPEDYPQDPFLHQVAWRKDPTPYGPVWELLAGAGAALAGENLVWATLVFKLIPGAFFLGSVLVVAAILRREDPGNALAGTLLLAWNPVALYETWGNGHNDAVMVFWMLAAAWAVSRKRYGLAILALAAGALVKFIPALLIPAVVWLALQSTPGLREKAGFLLRAGAGALGLAALAYLPFWEGPQVLTVVNRTQLFTASIPAGLYYALRPYFDAEVLSRVIAAGALALTGLFALGQAARTDPARPLESFAQAAFNILAFYLLFTCLWFQQWYTLWVIAWTPLLPLRPGGGLSRKALFGILFGFLALSKQFVAGPLLYVPAPRLEQPLLEILFTLGVLGIPWGLAAWQGIRDRG